MAQAASIKPSKDKSPERAVRPAHEPDRQSGLSGAQAQMLALQRTIGNRAIGQLLGSARVSPLSTTENVIPPTVPSVLNSGNGQPLDLSTRTYMESRFGYDFSQVRVHSGAAAEQSAQDVHANAYTVGHNMVFGAGRFAPGTHEGRRLIAHELTHVVQQSGSDEIHVGQGDEKRSLSPITPRAPRTRLRMNAPGDTSERAADRAADAALRSPEPVTASGGAAATNAVAATSVLLPRWAPSLPVLQREPAPDAEPAKTESPDAVKVEGVASKSEGTTTAARSAADNAGQGAPSLGLSSEKAQAAAKEVVARVEGAAERGKAEVVQATRQLQWGTFKIPIEENLLKSKNVNRELAIRFFQIVLKQVGVELGYWMAERIHARLAWKDLSTEEHTRQVVSAQLAANANIIGYESNEDSVSAIGRAYFDILREDQERLRRAYEELHKVHYAEDAILSFYIAHVNGVISVVNGILDLPVAPVNLVQSVRGKEHYRFLGRIPKIGYVGDYGTKYGGAMETGVVLGLMLVPGAQGGAGAGLSSAEGGAALAEGASVAAPRLMRLLGGAKVAGPIIKVASRLLGVAGVAAGGQAAVDTVKAIEALKTGQITKEDGTVEPLTEEKAFELLEAILVSVLITKHTVKGMLGSKKGEGKEGALPEKELQGPSKGGTPPPQLTEGENPPVTHPSRRMTEGENPPVTHPSRRMTEGENPPVTPTSRRLTEGKTQPSKTEPAKTPLSIKQPLDMVLEWEQAGKIKGDLRRLKNDLTSADKGTRLGAEAEVVELESQIKSGKIPEVRGASKGPDQPDYEVKARTEPFSSQKNAENFFADRIKGANEQFKGANSSGRIVINLGKETTIPGPAGKPSQPINAEAAKNLVAKALSKGGRGTNITEVVVKDANGEIIYQGLGE